MGKLLLLSEMLLRKQRLLRLLQLSIARAIGFLLTGELGLRLLYICGWWFE